MYNLYVILIDLLRLYMYGCAVLATDVVVLCPAHTHLPVKNGLVNEVKFVALITQKL